MMQQMHQMQQRTLRTLVRAARNASSSVSSSSSSSRSSGENRKLPPLAAATSTFSSSSSFSRLRHSPSNRVDESHQSCRRNDDGNRQSFRPLLKNRSTLRRHLSFSATRSSVRSLSSSASHTSPLGGDVIVTKACADRLRKLMETKGQPGLRLRLSVESGGCSGFQYNFSLETDPPAEDDLVFKRGDAVLVVDEASMEFVQGATVDYQQDMMRSAFAVINNPNSENACGCGSSFAVKSFELNPAKD